MKIKTYPIQFTEDRLAFISEEAAKRKLSIKDFILLAIENELNKKGVK